MKRPKPEQPGPGQESVWDYPRPPRLEQSNETVEVVLGGQVIARTTRGWRVLETSHPPTYYLPREAFVDGALRPTPGTSMCEWKGQASYFDLVAGDAVAARAGWTYASPTTRFAELSDAIAVMPELVDRCVVNGETVQPQPGSFYGGWVTSRVVGPFKGAPGSWGW